MFTLDESALTYFEVLKRASSFLKQREESTFAAEWLMRERLSWTKTELISNYHQPMSLSEMRQFERDINTFAAGIPMQQIVGHDWFYGRKFLVNKHTLIPRPETEEWLDRVLALLPDRPLDVLDIGTGTGVLAITQKLERPADQVTATDISEQALKVALKNAENLEAEVKFKQGNLFEPVVQQKFDLILCNPPYISTDEIGLMDQSVLAYEPQSALFAAEDGLAIYSQLAASITNFLKSESYIFLEIGFKQGERVRDIFEEAVPTAVVEVWQDFNGLDRVVAIHVK